MHYFAAKTMEGPTKEIEGQLTNGRFSKKKFNGKTVITKVPGRWPDIPWHEWPVGLVEIIIVEAESTHDPVYW